MQDKQVDRAERDLLIVIHEIQNARGQVDRDRLRVEARGRGLEVSRPLAALREARLVSEITRKPFFLWRLFGARAVTRLQLTDAGLEALNAPEPQLAMAPQPVPVAPSEEPIPTPVVAPAPVVEPVPEPAPVPAPEPEPTPELPSLHAREIAARRRALARELAEDLGERPPAPAQEDDANYTAERRAPVRPIPAPARNAVGYTEELGGAPIDTPAPAPVAEVDPEVMDGLREMLQCFGMELTIAGAVLISDRIGRGIAPGEALLQVVTFAIAHALRHELVQDGGGTVSDLQNYGNEVLHEMAKLRDAGAIEPALFDTEAGAIRGLFEAGAGPEALAATDALLADPIGGSAPPALLPDDLRLNEEA